ncbi:MAG: hypothetical protein GXO64_00510 [Candidatus Micrarchaeota archaeon]|nr:hypothetical protein [Candidatus Micrarchaeota archaeon]
MSNNREKKELLSIRDIASSGKERDTKESGNEKKSLIEELKNRLHNIAYGGSYDLRRGMERLNLGITQGTLELGGFTKRQKLYAKKLKWLRKKKKEKEKELLEKLKELGKIKYELENAAGSGESDDNEEKTSKDIEDARSLIKEATEIIMGHEGLVYIQRKLNELEGVEARAPRPYLVLILKYLKEYERALEGMEQGKGGLEFKNFGSWEEMHITKEEMKAELFNMEKESIKNEFEGKAMQRATKRAEEEIRAHEEWLGNKIGEYEKEINEIVKEINKESDEEKKGELEASKEELKGKKKFYEDALEDLKENGAKIFNKLLREEYPKAAGEISEEMNKKVKDAAERIEAQHEFGVSGGGPWQYFKDAMPGRNDLFHRGRRAWLGRGHDTVYPALMEALFLGIIGIILGAFFGSVILVVAFSTWAMSALLPDAQKETTKSKDGKTEIEVWRGRGTATVKAFAQMTALILGLYFLYTSNFPLSVFLMLLLAFGGYGSFPVTWDEERTDEFIKSFVRMFLGVVVISIWIFGNLFQSKVLMWMGILFLAVPPIRRSENADAIRAGGEDMFYRILFLIGMGYIFYGVTSAGGWGLAGASLYIFYLIWGMSFVSGLFSAVEDMPKIGTILLIVALILFGTTGTGQENIGTAMFGQWWPTVHNSITNTLEPLGEVFGGFSKTFGAGWMMFTNPMGYAQQIMDGNYAKNPTGATGAYGLEIRNLAVDTIYPGEPFTVRFELDNMGPKDASAVNITITSSIGGFDLTMESGQTAEYKKDHDAIETKGTDMGFAGAMKEMVQFWKNPVGTERLESQEEMRTRNYWTFLSDQRKINRGDILPVFLVGKIDCLEARQALWKSYSMPSSVMTLSNIGRFGVNTPITVSNLATPGKRPTIPSSSKLTKQKSRLGDGNPDALKYITFRVIEEYKYSTDSVLQIKFISDERWRELTREGKNFRHNVPSTMTSGPIKLNLGTMDQPIKAGSPFFVGFNISTPKTKAKISGVTVRVKFPFEVNADNLAKCSRAYSSIKKPSPKINDSWVVTWELGNGPSFYVFCHFDGSVLNMPGPEKTFTIQADAEYTITAYRDYDTQTSFKDTCFTKMMTPARQTVASLGVVHVESHNTNGKGNVINPNEEKPLKITVEIPKGFGSNGNEKELTIEIKKNEMNIPSEIDDIKANYKTETITKGSKDYDITVLYELTKKKDKNGKEYIELTDVYVYEVREHKKSVVSSVEELGDINITEKKIEKVHLESTTSKLIGDVVAKINVPFEPRSSKIDKAECNKGKCEKDDNNIYVRLENIPLEEYVIQSKVEDVTVEMTAKDSDGNKKEYKLEMSFKLESTKSAIPDDKNEIDDINNYITLDVTLKASGGQKTSDDSPDTNAIGNGVDLSKVQLAPVAKNSELKIKKIEKDDGTTNYKLSFYSAFSVGDVEGLKKVKIDNKNVKADFTSFGVSNKNDYSCRFKGSGPIYEGNGKEVIVVFDINKNFEKEAIDKKTGDITVTIEYYVNDIKKNLKAKFHYEIEVDENTGKATANITGAEPVS